MRWSISRSYCAIANGLDVPDDLLGRLARTREHVHLGRRASGPVTTLAARTPGIVTQRVLELGQQAQRRHVGTGSSFLVATVVPPQG